MKKNLLLLLSSTALLVSCGGGSSSSTSSSDSSHATGSTSEPESSSHATGLTTDSSSEHSTGSDPKESSSESHQTGLDPEKSSERSSEPEQSSPAEESSTSAEQGLDLTDPLVSARLADAALAMGSWTKFGLSESCAFSADFTLGVDKILEETFETPKLYRSEVGLFEFLDANVEISKDPTTSETSWAGAATATVLGNIDVNAPMVRYEYDQTGQITDTIVEDKRFYLGSSDLDLQATAYFADNVGYADLSNLKGAYDAILAAVGAFANFTPAEGTDADAYLSKIKFDVTALNNIIPNLPNYLMTGFGMLGSILTPDATTGETLIPEEVLSIFCPSFDDEGLLDIAADLDSATIIDLIDFLFPAEEAEPLPAEGDDPLEEDPTSGPALPVDPAQIAGMAKMALGFIDLEVELHLYVGEAGFEGFTLGVGAGVNEEMKPMLPVMLNGLMGSDAPYTYASADGNIDLTLNAHLIPPEESSFTPLTDLEDYTDVEDLVPNVEDGE